MSTTKKTNAIQTINSEETCHQHFFTNSGTFVSESLEIIEEMFPLYYMHKLYPSQKCNNIMFIIIVTVIT